MIKTSTLAVILGVMVLSIVLFADEAEAGGLVKRAISTAGTWLVSDIPDLPASKITSGTFSKTMIGSSGTFPWSEISKTGSSIHDLANVTSVGCASGEVLKVSGTTWQCAADSTGSGISSINSDSTAVQVFSGTANNVTITDTGAGTLDFNLGSNVLMTGGSTQTITKALTINSGTLGGNLNAGQFAINNLNVETITTTDTLTTTNEIVLLNPSTTAFTVTLPDANGNTGKHYRLFYVATTGTVVTIDGDASDTINGRTSISLKYPYSVLDLYSDGTNWQGIYNTEIYGSENDVTMYEECTGGIGTSSTVGSTCNNSWTMIETGTGTALFVDGEVDHLGIKRLATSAASGDDTIIYMGSTAILNVFDSDDAFDLTFIVRPVSSVATVTYMVGANANTAAASLATNENAQFMFSSADPQWQCRTRSVGGTDQTTDSGVTVTADTWYNLRVLKDSGTIRFLINDVNVCNHSTQIPSSALSPFVLVETTTTAARSLDFDYFRGSFTMTGR